MHTVYRYVVKELLLVLCVVFAILIFIGVGFRLTGYLQEAANGRFDADVLWTLIALRLPEFVQIVLPFSLFLAIVVTLGRVHADQEFVVLVSGGMGPIKMIGWLLSIVVPCSVVVGLLSLQVTPRATSSVVGLVADQAISSEIAAIVPGKFRMFSGGSRTIYSEGIDRDSRTLSGVFYSESKDDRSTIVIARTAQIRIGSLPGERLLVLKDGRRYEGTPGKPNYRVINFEELALRLELEEALPLDLALESRPTTDLDLSVPEDAQELHWRIALPIITLVGCLFAYGISRTKPRSGRFGQIVPGILIFVSYYVLLVLARQGMAQNTILNTLGLWPVHALVGLAAIYTTIKQSRPA
ncbi:MAG: LPS export ABC transporter permease LptF [Gammaproteobacteria bacterium]|nr:LPS export ABC transporter permease LptF [Gammaproteobacteria bacterium]